MNVLKSSIKIIQNLGTLILVDVPLFIIPNSAHTENPVDLDVVLEENVKQLNEDDRRHFYSLADCKVNTPQIFTY